MVVDKISSWSNENFQLQNLVESFGDGCQKL